MPRIKDSSVEAVKQAADIVAIVEAPGVGEPPPADEPGEAAASVTTTSAASRTQTRYPSSAPARVARCPAKPTTR
mgnify:CR=1 FL=1